MASQKIFRFPPLFLAILSRPIIDWKGFIDCWNYIVLLQFVTVIQAISSAGKQLQQLNIGEEDNEKLHSNLLKKLILTASSASVMGSAAKMLSFINKESADQGDMTNLIIASDGRFSEVYALHKDFCIKLFFFLHFRLHYVFLSPETCWFYYK